MTPAEQLNFLLPLLNEPDRSTDRVRSDLHDFLFSFKGQRLRLPDDSAHWLVHDAPAKELAATRAKLTKLFETSFWFSDEEEVELGKENITWQDVLLPLTFPSLSFGAARGPYVKRSTLGRKERREGAAYDVLVRGNRLRDVVGFLALHLLTMPGHITLGRCEACQKMFVVTLGTRGRPRKVCPGGACKQRVDAQRKTRNRQLTTRRKSR